MIIDIQPETGRLVQEELQSGHFRSVDDLIVESVSAWREKHGVEQPAGARRSKKNFAQFLLESPLPGSDLKLDRQKDYPRTIDL